MRVALVSRELYPYVGGGIAPIVAAAARELAEVAEVTVVTAASAREEHERLVAAGDERVLPAGVRLVWVEEPEDRGPWLAHMHAYSGRVDAALREAYGHDAPDVIEFCDYLGEGFVTVQARHTRDPWLDHTLVCIRLHTTSELCAVLDGALPDDLETVATHDMERYCLRHADRLLWSGGDVLETYRRYYGRDALAPGHRLADAFLAEGATGDDAGELSDDGPLRLLFLGRAERRKGVQNLMRAITSNAREDVELTLLGGDTRTGPLQGSLRRQLELMAAGDDRIRLEDPVPRAEVHAAIRRAHVVVVPSLWECWPNVVREAFQHNRPVLGTPVGGIVGMVEHGVNGWLTEHTGADAILKVIEHLLDARHEVTGMIASGAPRAAFERIADRRALRDGYLALADERPLRVSRPVTRAPLVSVVIPYFRMERHIHETLDSVLAQTHPRVEIIVANDGSLRQEDAFLFELAEEERITLVTQANAGLSAARNLGIRHARGRYVLPLDADDVLLPSFVERCVAVMEADPELAYVTTWVQYMTPDSEPIAASEGGYMPFGNWSRLIERNNVGGTCTSLLRRRLFDEDYSYDLDMTSYEDWLLFRQLAGDGRFGAVIPERLFRYRVRPQSMMRTDGLPNLERLAHEVRAHTREKEIRWTTG